MKKKMLLAAVCISALIFNVTAGSKLLNYIPAGVDGIVSIKIKQILDVPIFKEKRTTDPKMKKQWGQFETELKNYGLTLNDLPTQAMVFFAQAKELNGAVIKTSLSEKRFVEILNKAQKEHPHLYSTRKLNGHTVYVLNDKSIKHSKLPIAQHDIPALTFIKSDIAMVSNNKTLDKIVNAAKNNTATVKSLMAKSAAINQNALVWLVFKNNTPATPPTHKPGQHPSMLDGIIGIGLSLDFTGAKKRDLGLNAMVSCRDDNAAAGLNMQLQGLIMMGSAMAFKNNPKLGSEIGKAITVKPNGSNISIKISIPEALANKIQKYVDDQKAQHHKHRNLKRKPIAVKQQR